MRQDTLYALLAVIVGIVGIIAAIFKGCKPAWTPRPVRIVLRIPAPTNARTMWWGRNRAPWNAGFPLRRVPLVEGQTPLTGVVTDHLSESAQDTITLPERAAHAGTALHSGETATRVTENMTIPEGGTKDGPVTASPMTRLSSLEVSSTSGSTAPSMTK